jgi:hypothetical protein
MILSDDIRTEVSKALGHLCVPFSTEEEANEGADTIILLFLKMIKAYIKANNIVDVRPLQFFGELWVGLASFDNYGAFKRIQSRFLNSYDLISDYESSDVSKESKQIIKTELKSRGLL